MDVQHSSNGHSPHTIEEWTQFAQFLETLETFSALTLSPRAPLHLFNAYMQSKALIFDYRITLADKMMFRAIHNCIQKEFNTSAFPIAERTTLLNVARWYTYLSLHTLRQPSSPSQAATEDTPVTANDRQNAPASSAKDTEKHHHPKAKSTLGNDKHGNLSKPPTDTSYEGKLVGAEIGKVVLRFPPEPSGFLHIGHAKAVLLNNYYKNLYQGQLIVRFDDTNPCKEKMEFESAIIEDLKQLHVAPDKISHTSDYFDYLQRMMSKLLQEGRAYVDDTPVEQMRYERGNGIESKARSNTLEENLALWEEMKLGSEKGCHCCVRGRIDMKSNNKCMRDPVLYRCITELPHYRLGNTYKAYPTYDFACPIVDELEGVTHALRTNEYSDRIPQYQWVLKAANLRPIHIYEFSRLNFVKTILSKRKLTWFVDNGLVEGWDDPRFPTVRGVLRRGLRVEALLSFILEQGPSKSVNLMEWDKLWAKNKQMIDPLVPRYMAVEKNAIVFILTDGPNEPVEGTRPLHPKDASMGTATITFYREILVDLDDATSFQEGEEITLMRWGNAVVDKIYKSQEGDILLIEGHLHLDGDFKKTKQKVHWLPKLDSRLCECTLVEYDHLILADKIDGESDWEKQINPVTVHHTCAWGDILVEALPYGTFLQFERRGYFRLERAVQRDTGDTSLMLIKIPDGRSKAVSKITTKVNVAALAGKTV